MKIIYLESNLLEKSTTKPDKQAIKMLINSGLFTEEESKEIIDELFTKKKIHAFTHSGSWMDKYIKGIARMIVEEANGDKNKAEKFINNNDIISVFDSYLSYVKANRDKQDNPTEFDKDFVDNLSFEEIKDFVNQNQSKLDQQSKDELSKMEFTGNLNYELIPIDSYNELHSKFGGELTGNGTGDLSAWCHTNGEGTYNSWVNGGNKFFILARKDFKDIPFDKKSNSKNPKDEYGNSLIALLVNKYGNLKNATLRCNHEGVYTNPDNQYETYAELSKVAGFNVEKKIRELGSFEEPPIIKDGIWYYDGKEIEKEFRDAVIKVIVEEGVTEVGDYAFDGCTSLTNITIPDSVTEIGNGAFYNCTSLTNITIPDSVTEIGRSAFTVCKSLTNITIPNSVTEIGDYAFAVCKSLTNITIPNSVTEIGDYAFTVCKSLTDIIIPDNVTKIGDYVFSDCTSLTNIKIPDSVTKIGHYAFQYCGSLKSITIPDSVTEIGDYAFRECTSLKEIIIPDSVTKIGIFIFFKCPNLTVKCYKGSYAEQYCIRNGIPYEII